MDRQLRHMGTSAALASGKPPGGASLMSETSVIFEHLRSRNLPV